MLVLYALQRAPGLAAVQPAGVRAVLRAFGFNTAASFTTNTNWQAYAGESTMSYLTQMAGLAYHNFVSAAVGIALAIAFIRGIARREQETIGNFWVDMTRALLWVLLPFCVVGALFFVSQGVVQNLKPYDVVPSRRRRTRHADHRAGSGRVAGDHQAVRHQRRRLLQRQQRAPVREPDAGSRTSSRCSSIFVDPGGSDLDARRHDRIAPARLGGLGGDGVPVRRPASRVTYWAEARGNPLLAGARSAGRARSSPAATWRARRCGSASPTPRCSRR